MTLTAIPFPVIDPILIQFGPIAIRWYALAYIFGILLAWHLIRRMVANPRLWTSVNRPVISEIDDFIIWATVGIIVGGRLGYVLFYNPSHYFSNPLEIPMVWRGGMSFHGGLVGMILVILIFSHRKKLSSWVLFDLSTTASPIGIFFGRLANFINSELWGRTTDVPWAIVFPNGGPDPRHPSQLYEGLLEGLLLCAILMWFAYRKKKLSQPGFLTGAFGVGYGTARFFCEFFRDPDSHIGFLFGGATMGMVLSLPVIIAGIIIIYWSYKRPVDSMTAK